MKKQCDNKTCGTYHISVDTDAKECISCSKELKSSAQDFIDAIFGDKYNDPLTGGPLGGL